MQGKRQFYNLISRSIARAAAVSLAIATVFALTAVLTPSAQAQTFKVIHTFTGKADGGAPAAGLTMDRAGNLYGTNTDGGTGDWGIAFKLSHESSGWVLNPLYNFAGGSDGAYPEANVIFGPDGSLYGSTQLGGDSACNPPYGCGTVFNLKPYPTACKTALCGWQETVLHRFTGGSDGGVPGNGDLVFDQAGSLYGTTGDGGYQGGACSENGGCGVVFELTPSNGGWTESVLYSFTGGSDGSGPSAGVIFDSVGNLYGATGGGGANGYGTLFELTPSGSGWTEKVLYSFQGGNDGFGPQALIFDQSGNLYGTMTYGGSGNGGTVFELRPSNGSWTLNTLYSFSGSGYGPRAGVVMDGEGNLYGTTYGDGGCGNVFKLAPSGNGWTYTDLHDFTGGDGCFPEDSVTVDPNGNLYGTTFSGGTGTGCGISNPCGVVWEITP